MEVDGISVEAAEAIQAASIVSGAIAPGTGHLILTTAGGTESDAGLVVADTPIEGTKAEYDAALADGDFVYQSEVGGAWTNWAVTGHSGWTVGNGTQKGRYKQVGKIVHWELELVFGSTSGVTGTIQIEMPVNGKTPASITQAMIHMGSGFSYDLSLVAFFAIQAFTLSGTYLQFATHGTAGYLAALINGNAWATGDVILASGSYEAA